MYFGLYYKLGTSDMAAVKKIRFLPSLSLHSSWRRQRVNNLKVGTKRSFLLVHLSTYSFFSTNMELTSRSQKTQVITSQYVLQRNVWDYKEMHRYMDYQMEDE